MEELISRQAVLDLMQLKMGGKELYKAVYDMPPVTPTHGTCKDCKYCGNKYANHRIYCSWLGGNYEENFYCADFEKRGSE